MKVVLEATKDLLAKVELQLFYLDQQDTGPFDPNPVMLRNADNEVRKSAKYLKELLANSEQIP
jgi:hypothetical protein